MKNNLGFTSLLIAFSGLLVFEVLIYMEILTHSGWHIVKAGFEAATIGGVADWFAVRALFHEIPIPFIRKHTNIIVKNREKMTEGIVDLVTNEWLSPEVISEKLNEVDIASAILEFLQNPESQQKSIGFIREIALKLTTELDHPEFVATLQKMLNSQITNLDLASPIGNYLEKAVNNGEHHKLWELLIEASEKSINNAETKELILSKLEEAIKEYGEQGFFKKTTMFLAQKTGGLNINSLTAELLFKTNEMLVEAKENPQHPIRIKFDDWIIEFAQNLVNGRENEVLILDNIKTKLIAYMETEQTVQNLVRKFKQTFASQLDTDDTPLMQFFKTNFNRIVLDLQNDKEAQRKINTWITESISALLTKFHSEIGNMVRSSMIKLNNEELVEQIEGKVGSDLQYIRLNGAVVGGMVGVLLATAKLLLQ
ncbi:DUF445 domain-containing protein [Flavobacterium antarcticum]|uniref:DUF445 domain-containing protein n=1 Tax=Flavobacterium antarcticum TaxID=271155 RepID=UPI0003B330C2|nr:DUF445 domain-containing protein [Flavobacterium antarcticum]